MPELLFPRKLFRLSRLTALRVLSVAGTKAFPPIENRSVIIAPHPDDETFGTGGLISVAREQGVEVRCVFLTSGDGSHRQCCGMDQGILAARREAQARKAAGIMGVPESCLHFLRLPDGKLPHSGQPGFPEASHKLTAIIAGTRPDQVFAPHPYDGWSDHIAAEQLTRSAMAQAGSIAELYHYCVWFWFSMPLRRAFKLDWRNAFTLDISEALEKKRLAMDVYLRDLAPCGKPYCGELPPELLRAFRWNKELYFPARDPGLEAWP